MFPSGQNSVGWNIHCVGFQDAKQTPPCWSLPRRLRCTRYPKPLVFFKCCTRCFTKDCTIKDSESPLKDIWRKGKYIWLKSLRIQYDPFKLRPRKSSWYLFHSLVYLKPMMNRKVQTYKSAVTCLCIPKYVSEEYSCCYYVTSPFISRKTELQAKLMTKYKRNNRFISQ